LISGVIVRSGICSSLAWRELLEPVETLFSLPSRFSDRRDDVHDGRGNTVFAIGLDLLATSIRTSIDEELLDDVPGYEPDRLLALAGLPGLHHRGQSFAATEPLMEGIIIRAGQVTGNDEPPDHLGGVRIVCGDYKDAAGDVRGFSSGRLRSLIGDTRDPPGVLRRNIVRDDAVRFRCPQAYHPFAQGGDVDAGRCCGESRQAKSPDVIGADGRRHLLAGERLLEEGKCLAHAREWLLEGNTVPVLDDRRRARPDTQTKPAARGGGGWRGGGGGGCG